MTFDYTARVDMSPELRAFLRDWLDKAETGNWRAQPYNRTLGLCSNAPKHLAKELHEIFVSFYPFGKDDYFHRQRMGTMHLCPKRLAWVRANSEEMP